MQKKRCFIISPIGEEGSEIRQHADDVYDYIIKPAMEACDIDAFRADHLKEPGKISEQMYNEILSDDLCVAVLTGSNPNVYYELAIAQAAARPVVILLEKGQNLPFDVSDLRCVYYTLNPRPLFEKVYVNEIVEHIKSLERSGWKGTIPWGELSQAAQDQPLKFLEHSADYGNPDAWLQLLRNTENVFEIMGISLGSWRRTKAFSQVLKEKAAAGCKVRLLLMHKDNPVLRHLINDAIPEARYSSVTNEIDEVRQYLSDTAEQEPNVEVRQMLQGCPHCQLTRSDQSVVFIPYLYSERSHYSPLWQVPQDSSLYTIMAQEFESLWNANAPAAAT